MRLNCFGRDRGLEDFHRLAKTAPKARKIQASCNKQHAKVVLVHVSTEDFLSLWGGVRLTLGWSMRREFGLPDRSEGLPWFCRVTLRNDQLYLCTTQCF